MKLRIRGNSVRLRLTQSEVARFGHTGAIKETVEFGAEASRQFSYTLETTCENYVNASFENNGLRVFVPNAQAADWINSGEVGIEAAQNVGDGKFLRILIEKDFACFEARPFEDESDSFPHPA